MARFRTPEGVEVLTGDERARGKFSSLRNRKIFHRGESDRRTGRQRFEASIRAIFRGGYDYVTGEGDDVDRALHMLGLKDGGDAPEPSIVDDDFE